MGSIPSCVATYIFSILAALPQGSNHVGKLLRFNQTAKSSSGRNQPAERYYLVDLGIQVRSNYLGKYLLCSYLSQSQQGKQDKNRKMAAALKRLHIRVATPQDAPRIAEIHMAAFGPNAMLHAQFPTPAIRQGLQTCVEDKALADINDQNTTVLVVTGSDGKEWLLSKCHTFMAFVAGGECRRIFHCLFFNRRQQPEAQNTPR